MQAARHRKRPALAQRLAQALAFNIFHHNEWPSIFGDVQIVDAYRMRMLQSARDDGLGLKAPDQVFILQAAIDHLDGANLAEGKVLGAIHRGHSSGANLLQH